ncbi:MAG: hypothetical protein JW829_06520 [Pirellulales bacterium]|nr:hypothetical protein [Pirellulales bacterium]
MTHCPFLASPTSIRWARIQLSWLLFCFPGNLQAQPAIDGYRDFAALRIEFESIAANPVASLSSIGMTQGGREIPLLTLSISASDKKPAILVVGNVDAPHRVGSELAIRLARHLADRAETDPRIKKLLTDQTVYIIPCPTPDASEAFFLHPAYERTGNVRATDDDRDGVTNEDPPEDLNGDGLITMMRIEDPTGTYIPHPVDPRVMIQADPQKNERGKYRLIQEGIDNDKDEQFNEDGPGGVDFNRNFPFHYPYFESGAGPHQVSEPETRAVADFAFDHPNIYCVLTFSPHDNLSRPWKSDPSSETAKIKTAVPQADAVYYQAISKLFHSAIGSMEDPISPSDRGSFAHWVYFHFGRWSFASRGWWIPSMEGTSGGTEQKTDHVQETDSSQGANKELESEPTGKYRSDAIATDDPEAKDLEEDQRGVVERNALRWFEREGIHGFVPWTPISHPDFSNKKVEIGGFRPFLLLNPPASMLDPLAASHANFMLDFAELRPRLAISADEIVSLGEGIYRLVVTIRNEGFLPTMSSMGAISRQLVRLEATLDLPNGAQLVTGSSRVPLAPLAGAGGYARQEWLISAPKSIEKRTARITASSPTLGTVETTIELP